jgi:hypothetical protein
VANVEESLLAAPSLTVDADPRRWLDHTFMDIPQDKVKEFTVKPADGAGYSASRPSKEQTDFAVTGVPKGRELSNPTAADPIAGSLSALTLDDVQHPPATIDPKSVSHATFKTFDGLSLDVAGRKDGTRTLISVVATSTDKASAAQAATLNTQTGGWEYEIPPYKYDAIFRPLEDLLQKLPDKKTDEKKKPTAHAPAGSAKPSPATPSAPTPAQ